MKSSFWLFVPALFLTFSSCEDEDAKDYTSDGQVYFNSFESESDTAGWTGNAFSFAEDAPAHGGKRSLSISGGCLIPHARYTISDRDTGYYLTLKFWGKNLSNGGYVSLHVNAGVGKGIGLSVSEKDWTLYESPDTLFCPANTTLTLEGIAGGISGSAILVDMIEVRKLKAF